MTMFNERERAFENLFAHEEELRFLAVARRNQLFARWAAEQIGLRESECRSYVRSFTDSAVLPRSEDALIARVRADFIANGVETSDKSIAAAMEDASASAARQMGSGGRGKAV